MIYKGYKIEKSPSEKIGWNLYWKSMPSGRWVWAWSYDTLDEAKAVVDHRLEG